MEQFEYNLKELNNTKQTQKEMYNQILEQPLIQNDLREIRVENEPGNLFMEMNFTLPPMVGHVSNQGSASLEL